MNKLTILIGLLVISFAATGKENIIDKAVRESIIGKLLKNKANIDIVNRSKEFKQWSEKKETYTVKSKKRELSECMGKGKTITNETINCYYGE